MTAKDAKTTRPVVAENPFTGSYHRWVVDRRARTFAVRVIEPGQYAPATHGEIFSAVLSQLISPAPDVIDPLASNDRSAPAEPFDLVTFPEAFVPVGTLMDALRLVGRHAPSGCVHAGLRPSDDPSQHLFAVHEIGTLVDQLVALPTSVEADLAAFRSWLGGQPSERRFNIGCLFAVDVEKRLRLCLHPKVVRSRFETNALPEHHMDEANHLALVTLHPVDKLYFSVTMQPLICSDALNLQTDRKTGSPMQAVNTHADCFGVDPPDHIDVVSVASCTPQTDGQLSSGAPYRTWHEQFQDSFRQAANDGGWTRHHHAAFVLSNFLQHEAGIGGLSGVFMPVPPHDPRFHPDVILSGWGRPRGDNPGANRWSTPDEPRVKDWQSRGFIAALSPFAGIDGVTVRIFGFTIQRLPRDNSRWETPASLTRCEVQVGRRDDTGAYQFERRKFSNAS